MHEELSNLSWSHLNSNILCQDWPLPGRKVYYVGVRKQSQTGLFLNDRLLVLETTSFTIFYSKYMHSLAELRYLASKGTTVIKERVNVLASTVEVNGTTVTVKWGLGRNWLFQFSKEQLAQSWLRLFTEVQEQSFTHSLKSKHTVSTSEYASILPSNPQMISQNENSHHKKSQTLEDLRLSHSEF